MRYLDEKPVTGADIDQFSARPEGWRWSLDSYGESYENYRVNTCRLSEVGLTVPREERKQRGGSTGSGSGARARNLSELYSLQATLAEVKEVCARLYDAACEDDPYALGLYGRQYREQLDVLWRYRALREETWAEIINVLQTVTSGLVFEHVEVAQVEALVAGTRNGLLLGVVGEEQVEELFSLLMKAGLDPWKAISPVSIDDE